MKIRLLCVCFMVVLSLSACGSLDWRKDAEKHMESHDNIREPEVKGVNSAMLDQALASEKAGNYDKAALIYKQLIDKEPENPVYNTSLADALRRQKEYKTSIAYYSMALKKAPDSLDAKEGKGLSLLNLGDFQNSMDLLSSVIQVDRSRWRSLNGLGIILTVMQKTNDALEYFKAAVQASGENPSVLNNIGLALAINQDYEGAVKSLELADAKSQEGSAERRRIEDNLAAVYGIKGDLGKAESILKRNMNEAEVYNNLGYYAKASKNSDLARSYFNMALTSSPVYYRKAWENLESLDGRK